MHEIEIMRIKVIHHDKTEGTAMAKVAHDTEVIKEEFLEFPSQQNQSK